MAWEVEMGSRNPKIDVIKGIGIILMVAAHALCPFRQFIYLFHMPIFYIASGYLFNPQKVQDRPGLVRYTIRKLKKLWIPFFATNSICILLHNVFIKCHIYFNAAESPAGYVPADSGVTYMTALEKVKEIIKCMFFLGGSQIGAATWFLRSLFMVSVLFAIFDILFRNILRKFDVVVCHGILSFLLLMAGYILQRIEFPSYSIGNLCSVYVLYFLGYVIREKDANKFIDKHRLPVIVGAFLILLFCYNLGIGSVDLIANLYPNPLFLIVASISGWFLMYSIASLMQGWKYSQGIIFIGKNTMPIILLHFLCFKIVNFGGVVYYGLPFALCGVSPVLFKDGYWWAPYTIAGVLCPLLVNQLYIYLKKRICSLLAARPNERRNNLNLDSKRIIELIEPYPAVTFDVFDTLIKRNVTSFKDTVNLMDKEYFDITGKRLPFYFYRERVHAPKAVIKKKEVRDVSLDDIYSVLHIDDKELIKKIEFKVELECVTINPSIFKVYEYCIKNNKRVFAISDMYLDKKQILLMLKKCGYDLEKIYVSQEYDVSKASGGLFAHFLEESKIKPENVIHIGDNFQADICGAKKVGMHTVHIPNLNHEPIYIEKSKFRYCLKENILYQSINNGLLSMDDNMKKIGYEILGPILYYYTKWLHEQIIQNNIRKLYFLSRDGYLLMKAYEFLYQHEDMELYYLSISSKSIKNPYQNVNNQKELLTQYLKQNQMYGKVGIVDIGWGGHLHKMLKEITVDFSDIYGFYFGTFKMFYENVNDGGKSGGYLRISRWERAKVLMNAGFIEILFSDTLHGTTEGYDTVDGEVQPVISEANPNGEIIRKIQSGALQFLKDWDKSAYSCFDYSPAYLIRPVLKLSMNPRQEDVDIISEEYEGGGTDYQKLSDVQIDGSGLPVFLKKLRKVAWKGGFIKKNCRIPLLGNIYRMINPVLVYFRRGV